MKTFLSDVAKALYKKYGDEVSSLSILFPSVRARLFFNDALSSVIGKPVWQPRYTSIDELMEGFSDLAKADNIRLVTELYKVYSRYHEETFDSFYFWGEILLSDFDSVDKYLIDARTLFRNVADLKELESDTGYLTPGQLEIINRFWGSFGESGTYSEEKQKFLNIWNSLLPVYNDFRGSLSRGGIGYTGMIYRDVAEKIRAGRVRAAHNEARSPGMADRAISTNDSGTGKPRYVIAGFNALSECEKVLFRYLDNTCEVDFFWDYDNYYVDEKEQEAGMFLRENIRAFHPSPIDYTHDGFSGKKTVTVVSSPSDTMQCKYAGDVLRRLRSEGVPLDKSTAIVLTDENLLDPLLYSLPPEADKINVTMGYPLKLSTEYAFAERLIELQMHKKERSGRFLYYHSEVRDLLGHPYVGGEDPAIRTFISEIGERQYIYVDSSMLVRQGGIVGMIFEPVAGGWEQLSSYLIRVLAEVATAPALSLDAVKVSKELENKDISEDSNDLNIKLNALPGNAPDTSAIQQEKKRRAFIGLMIENIRIVTNSLRESGIAMTEKIFLSVLRKVLQGVRISYEGEPLEGVQVMGILETRNLDFRNVVLLSMNDDNFPGNRSSASSFIPFNLRLAYGLPTPRHHEGVYAYYFYRLLQRAENVHLVYCSKSDEKSTGEQSRYIYQLEFESPHDPIKKEIGLNVVSAGENSISIEKTGAVSDKLGSYLSPDGPALSPTALYNYLVCPLKFYYYSVARIFPERDTEEGIDAPMMGTILHRAMEILYKPLIGFAGPQNAIAGLRNSQAVEKAVREAINECYLKDDSVSREDTGGEIILAGEIVKQYINTCILPFDAAQEGFVVSETEKRLNSRFRFRDGAISAEIRLTGLADRIDSLPGGFMRIVDYKTGRPTLDFKGISALFEQDLSGLNSAAFQVFLYCLMVYSDTGAGIQPALYFVRELNAEGYSPLLNDKQRGTYVTAYTPYREEFEARVRALLSEIFDLSVPFSQCDDIRKCRMCDYNEICKRA